jgi:hypothetical protein
VIRLQYSLVPVLVVGVMLVGGLVAACGASRAGRCVGETCGGDSAPQIFCARDTECAAEQFCNSGVCEPRNGGRPGDACTSHNDCAAGMFCNVVTGRCVECLNEDHCDPGLVCRADGTCGENAGCSSSADCGALKCDTATGTCVQCTSSGDCPIGQTCRNKQCFTNGGDPLCQSQADCDAYGKICDPTGHCLPCTSPTECGTGRTCTNGACVLNNVNPGDSCETSADCAGQPCFLNMCLPCFSDFMCLSLDDLLAGVSKICDPLTGACVDPQCQVAEQCPAGQGCYSGHCGACLDDAECRSGETCDPQTGVCDTSTPPVTCTSTAQCTGGRVCVDSNCVNCTSTTQCDAYQVCDAGRCKSNGVLPPAAGELGAACTGPGTCNPGLMCLETATQSTCTRTCIGSGNGGDADCPSGWACVNFDSGALDGVMLCESAAMLPAEYPGQPFSQRPGGSCASGNVCQTSICYDSYDRYHECARGCAADRDCEANECCQAMALNSAYSGYHVCLTSDPTNFKLAGEACGQASECDSGLCVGECSDGKSCNRSGDCASGNCAGICRDHCRANADCGAGLACHPWPTKVAPAKSSWVPACTPRRYNGAQNDGVACTQDSQCKSDWCIANICTTPCAITADCTGSLTGKKCEVTIFADDSSNPVHSMAFCR